VKIKPASLLHSIAEHFHHDASDFIDRFDILWESQTHKTGRIKTFVDLLMGCECELKAHAILSRLQDDPLEVYKSVRAAGHRIDRLTEMAHFMEDRTHYDFLKDNLLGKSVFIRYSLDAYDTFFPFDYDDADINYSETIGNHVWVMQIRRHLKLMIDASNDEFTGMVSNDISELFALESQMTSFMEKIRNKFSIG
jgi:hypothetical protein